MPPSTKMLLLLTVLVTFLPAFQFATPHCGDDRTLYVLKRSTYEFSVKLLDRVLQDTDGHFVFSPLSTWIQLASLAEGAKGQTLREIWKITRHHRRLCLKRKWRKLINAMEQELKPGLKFKSAMIIDKLLDVKHKFLKEVEQLNSLDVLLYNFYDSDSAANYANAVFKSATAGKIGDVLFPQDFNMTVLLTMDVLYYKSEWKYAFNPSYTTIKKFYSERGDEVGEVNMMKQIGYFNVTTIPIINARVLELPCHNNRMSLLIILPKKNDSIWNIYFYMQRIKLLSIFRLFSKTGEKLVNVELPRFKIGTDVDNIPELIYDMGARRLFRPDKAEFDGITDYSVFASLMSQVSDIEVTEEGVEAKSVVENLVSNDESLDFNANKPFLFLLIDRKLELILFAGAYSEPSVF